MSKLKTWKELPEADVLEGGTANEFETGDWRILKPTWKPEVCIQCLQCWFHCPDSAITVDTQTSKMTGFDYKHCKGCGICAKICPTKPKSIIMEKER